MSERDQDLDDLYGTRYETGGHPAREVKELYRLAVQARDERDEKDAEIARLREALESIWGQWAAGNVSAERAMDAVRDESTLTLSPEEAWAEWWGRFSPWQQALYTLANHTRTLRNGFYGGYSAARARKPE